MNLVNDLMNIVPGTTWVRRFDLTYTLRGTALGDSTWGAELGLVNPRDASEVYAVSSVANNKSTWIADGVLLVSFPQQDTALFGWHEASWYLDLISPATNIDPDGFRSNLLRGTLRCVSRATNS